eukprot:gene32794-37935_t
MADTSLLKFVDREQAYPAKREPELRAEDFREIAERYPVPDAEAQAGRCSQCGVPYCSVHCPLHNHIPDWLRLTAEGRLREAYELSNATSTMPEICGRICPQDRLCEGNCVIEFSGHGAVTIGAVETDTHGFTAELRGVTAALDRPVVEATSPECRAELGDRRCRVAMAGRRRFAQVVACAERVVTLDTSEGWPDAYGGGLLRWIGGANSGLEAAIAQSDGADIVLRIDPTMVVVPGDRVEVIE